MSEELWAEIQGYPNYLVSSHGRILNRERDNFLRPRPGAGGYYKVSLSNRGYVSDYYIHQLVAQAFFGNWRDYMRVSHVNGDTSNNAVENLKLREGKEPTVRVMRRESWGKRVILVETGEVFRTVRDLANYIGGDYSAIYRCLRGGRGRHLGYSFKYLEE